MKMPLEGIRVLDWTANQMGPVATKMLADLGADVIKIEPRLTGEVGRGVRRLMSIAFGIDGNRDFFFATMNRNKRGLAIDMKKDEGRKIIYELVAKSDVFVQNFRLDVAKRLGMDYETLSKINPMLICANGTGYGKIGADADKPSFDITCAARSGLMTIFAEPEAPPRYPVGALADQMGGVMLSYGIMTALLARERLGVGQEVDVSQLGAMVQLQSLNVSLVLNLGMEFPRRDRTLAGNPLWNNYKCADGKWLCLAMYQADRYWADFCCLLGINELVDDPRFVDLDARDKNCQALIAILDTVFASKSREDWLALFTTQPDFVYAPINGVSDLASDPQVVLNGDVADFDHPTFGPTKVVGLPVHLSKTPGRLRMPAPEVGQHTEEILIDVLGYDWDEIVRLRDAEVI